MLFDDSWPHSVVNTSDTLRAGTNGWTCLPDMPTTPGADPMCVDKGGMAWTEAWATHKDPPKGVVGFGYMLMGGSDPDNSDPFAMKPPAGLLSEMLARSTPGSALMRSMTCG